MLHTGPPQDSELYHFTRTLLLFCATLECTQILKEHDRDEHIRTGSRSVARQLVLEARPQGFSRDWVTKVFTPALTGVGERSHLLSRAINLDTHIDDIVNLMQWEDLSDVVLCGHSYGGGRNQRKYGPHSRSYRGAGLSGCVCF